ncbi:MAG: hypothetical protein ACREOO_14430 [bacterium]
MDPRKRVARQTGRPTELINGSYPDRIYDALWLHRTQADRLRARNARPAVGAAATSAQAVGDIVVIEDDGTLVVDPFNNPFDLDQRTLRFTPNASGSYDVTAAPFSFDPDLGTKINAGDDTNHEITFTNGFSFPFFGTTWNSVWVRSNGNVTFGGITYEFYNPNDFLLDSPMIAAFFTDLNPDLAVGGSGQLLYKQLSDRFVVTWDRITEFGISNSNTVQLTLFADGSFEFTYNGVELRIPIYGLPLIVGFNSGQPFILPRTVNLSDLPITGNVGQLYELFQETTYHEVDIVGVGQRFYAAQPDSFDQLVMMTAFELLNAPFNAFWATIHNEIQGLGLENVDFTEVFGSSGRLQSFLHMNYLNFWPDDPAAGGDRFSFLNLIGLIAGHRWSAYTRFQRDNQASDLLLGEGLTHWSSFLHTEGSVMGGSSWRDNGNGTFTSIRNFDNYSQLDHYLIGLRTPEEVAPFFLIDIPGVTIVERSIPPFNGATVAGPKRIVTVNDIVAVEGLRVPSREQAPKSFRQAYVLLTRPGQTPNANDLAKAERFRQAWEAWFADRTDGRGLMQTQLGVERPAATVEGTVTNALGGGIIRDFTVRLLERNYVQPVPDGGYYAFRTLADNLNSPPLPATIVITAFPYLPDTSTVTLAFGSTLQHHRALQPLPQSALRGTLSNAAGAGVKANLTLYVSSGTIDDFTLTTTSDAQGRFAFDNLYISVPGMFQYDSLVIAPEIPYVSKTVTNITLVAGAPTVVNVSLDPADLLLVNDDPAGAFQNFYQTALQTLGLATYVWRQAQRGVAPLSQASLFENKAIIWYTGNASGAEVLTAAERDSLSAYLDRGGRLLLTGQNIAESLNGNTFLANRLHVSFLRNLNDPILHGVKGDPVGNSIRNIANAGAGGASNQTSRDQLQPDAVAQACILYDTTSATVAGVRVEDQSKNSRVVFFGFGAEAISARTGFVSREAVLRSVLNWLEGTTAVGEPQTPAGTLALQFELSSSYPNPFSSSNATEVLMRYQLPPVTSPERVTLKLFDVLGREVATLVDEPYRPGNFAVRWNGRDRRGENVVSGVYFYKLEAGMLRQVRKLLLVR